MKVFGVASILLLFTVVNSLPYLKDPLNIGVSGKSKGSKYSKESELPLDKSIDLYKAAHLHQHRKVYDTTTPSNVRPRYFYPGAYTQATAWDTRPPVTATLWLTEGKTATLWLTERKTATLWLTEPKTEATAWDTRPPVTATLWLTKA
ncbi:uncharacterized protein [Diabrotica undecimpunctata]|uniref:uncharacterized protein n=1 Tax=Diabrotica undecimpunctata TaxID=50387 RepID=UPI003B6425E5